MLLYNGHQFWPVGSLKELAGSFASGRAAAAAVAKHSFKNLTDDRHRMMLVVWKATKSLVQSTIRATVSSFELEKEREREKKVNAKDLSRIQPSTCSRLSL